MTAASQRLVIPMIGPSGVGKSTLLKIVRPIFPSCEFIHLDGETKAYAHRMGYIRALDLNLLVHQGWPRFFDVGMETIRHLESQTDKHLIIDVGAGMLQDERSLELVNNYSAICIYAKPEIAHSRCLKRSKEKRTLQQYLGYEFTSHHVAMHGKCKFTLDTSGQAENESAETLAETLTQIQPTGTTTVSASTCWRPLIESHTNQSISKPPRKRPASAFCRANFKTARTRDAGSISTMLALPTTTSWFVG